LGGSPAHERIILANLASQLFEHGRITTTETRAKRVQPLAEKLITKAKRGDLHSRRIVFQTIRDRSVVHVLFTEIAPALAEREGGYTRITKIGNRKGDNAPMAIIEVISESVEESRRNKGRVAKASAAKPAAAAAKVEETVDEVADVVESPADDVEETVAALDDTVDEVAEDVADESDAAVSDAADSAVAEDDDEKK
jgi:large subunit ribosomal protein L17